MPAAIAGVRSRQRLMFVSPGTRRDSCVVQKL